MALSAGDKAKIIEEYRLEEGDTGSPEVQVAYLQTISMCYRIILQTIKKIITREEA